MPVPMEPVPTPMALMCVIALLDSNCQQITTVSVS